jgi:hypothetical protein
MSHKFKLVDFVRAYRGGKIRKKYHQLLLCAQRVNIFVTCHGNKIQIKPMKTTGASSIFS